MTARRDRYRWPSLETETEGGTDTDLELAARLGRRGVDRASHGRALVKDAAGELVAWVRSRPESWSFDRAGAELEAGLAAWSDAHAWRGVCARFLDALREVHHDARRRGGAPGPREALLEELGLWLASDAARIGDVAWDGSALGEGARLVNERDVVPAALRGLERGAELLVLGEGPLVADVLGEAQRSGLAPRVLVAEGGGDFAGRRLARELAERGVRTSLTYDVVALAALDRVDMLLVTTDSVGAGTFLARAGTGLACAEARRLDVPVRVLTTRDAVMPGGALRLPAWCDEEAWMLWPDAPAGVQLESQCYEIQAFGIASEWLTDAGSERPTDLCVRGMKTTAAPPCDAPTT
ncbi:MAG: hypothetical protein H6831_11865 [Planctomycetes bacterium]|nr:hypothetical protein [Planctomycetota bacterium]MCB9905097.1 hypothetical protein [Planctomycetota bacterium]